MIILAVESPNVSLQQDLVDTKALSALLETVTDKQLEEVSKRMKMDGFNWESKDVSAVAVQVVNVLKPLLDHVKVLKEDEPRTPKRRVN